MAVSTTYSVSYVILVSVILLPLTTLAGQGQSDQNTSPPLRPALPAVAPTASSPSVLLPPTSAAVQPSNKLDRITSAGVDTPTRGLSFEQAKRDIWKQGGEKPYKAEKEIQSFGAPSGAAAIKAINGHP